MPLAFAGLPLYVYAPKFYTDHVGLSLGLMGVLLIACRILDAVQDPVLGYVSERFFARGAARRRAIFIALMAMTGGFALLFNPGWAEVLGLPAAAWFVLSLVVTFSAYSLMLINYYAYGTMLTRDYLQQTRLSAWREGFSLLGVLLASLLPVALTLKYDEVTAFAATSIALAALALLAFGIFRASVPLAEAPVANEVMTFGGMLRALAANRAFQWLALAYLINGIAASIPATSVLFYVQDVLKSPEITGLFLALYFVAGAASMPVWSRAIARMGKKRAWLASMLMAAGAFVWAFLLGPGDVWEFALVCLLSGAALGADLAIPPAMLTDTLKPGESAAPYFGIWAFVAKLSLALASGMSLLLLDFGDYVPGSDAGTGTLAAVYALLPCGFKVVAFVILYASPLDAIFRRDHHA